MKEIKPIIKFVPLVLLGVCCMLTAFTGFSWYNKLLVYLYQIIGFSIFTNVYFLYFSVRFRMCMYTKIAVIGLMALNVFDIINLIHPIGKELYLVYNSIIVYFFFIISFLFLALRKETDNGATK